MGASSRGERWAGIWTLGGGFCVLSSLGVEGARGGIAREDLVMINCDILQDRGNGVFADFGAFHRSFKFFRFCSLN